MDSTKTRTSGREHFVQPSNCPTQAKIRLEWAARPSCGRPPVQSVSRPLRHLVAYGSTNKYRPVKNCKASGATAKRPTELVYFFCAVATMLTMTATVKAMDSQRWVCRTHLFQFNVTSSEDEPEADRAHLQVLRNPFGESVLLAERDEVQRVAEAHEAVDVRLHVEDVGHAGGSTDDATRPVVTQ